MRVNIKICGITNIEDARAAIDLGADAIGFNFYERSPRYIPPARAIDIISRIDPSIEKIGVFVNANPETVLALDGSLDYFQFHGDETPHYLDGIGKREKSIKVLRVGDSFDPNVALDYPVERFLLDTDTSGFGGAGKTFDWDAAIAFKQMESDFFLAGGLNSDNVADAIRRVRPFGVDVCSGVEREKGVKDHRKLEAFIRNARIAI